MKPEEIAARAADGDRYHQVNHEGIGTIADPVLAQMKVVHSASPIASVLEIGCTNGFRLHKAQQEFGAQCSGLEASAGAVHEGREKYPAIEIKHGIAPADLSQWAGSTFDIEASQQDPTQWEGVDVLRKYSLGQGYEKVSTSAFVEKPKAARD